MEVLYFKPLTQESINENDPRNILEEENELLKPDPNLKQGQVLSKEMMEQLQSDLFGIPLEDLDSFYNNKRSFVVIEKNGTINRLSLNNSFNILSPLSTLRRVNISLMTNWMFSIAMILVVLLNALDMILEAGFGLPFLEYVFIGFYIFEFLVKLIARGVIMEPFTCLRIYWNWLDLFIILTFPTHLFNNQICEEFFELTSALRILKLIPLFPGLRDEFDFLLTTCIGMIELIIIMPLTILVFAIAFLQMYMGILTNKCIQNTNINFNNSSEWETYVSNSEHWLNDSYSGEYEICGNFSSRGCPENYTCLNGFGPNPYYDTSSFDSIFYSYLSTVRIVTQDYWEELYTQLLETTGTSSIFTFIITLAFVTFPFGTFTLALIGSTFLNLKRDVSIRNSNPEEEEEEEGNELNNIQQQHDHHTLKYQCIKLCPTWNIFNTIIPYLSYLEYFITFTIVYDIICMSLDHNGIENSIIFTNFIKISELVVFYIYLIECITKLIILNPKVYFNNTWGIYDFLLVLFWCLENIFNIRLLFLIFMRVFKLVPRLPSVQRVFQIILNALISFKNIFSITIIFIIISSLIGTTLHSENFYNNIVKFHGNELPRWNFNDFTHSYLLVFRILAGEWIETLWDTIYVSGGYSTIIHHGATLIIGNFFIMSLSVAIVLTTIHMLKSNEIKTLEQNTFIDKILKYSCLPFNWLHNKIYPQTIQNLNENHTIVEDLEILHDRNEIRENHRIETNVLGWKTYLQFSTSPYFHKISITIVIISTWLMVFGQPNSGFMFYMNVTFIVYFLIELLLRVISGGMREIIQPGWIFDLCIVVDMLVSVSVSHGDIQYPKGYLYLQCLRPLMLMSRVKGLQVVVKGICKEIRFIWKYVLALLFIWLGFGLPALKMFSGTFFKCLDLHGKRPDIRVVKNLIECDENNFTWTNSERNFDHIGNSFISLFSVASTTGWLNILTDAVDSRQQDEQPHRDVNIGVFMYFIVFLVLGVFLPLNILFGILIHHLKKPEMFGIFMTESEKGSYVQKEQNPPPNIPDPIIPRPTTTCQKGFYDIVTNIKFETIILILICFDLINMSMDHQSNSNRTLIQYFHYSFAVIMILYFIEFLMKICAWRQHYFKKWINIFDFIVVMDGIIGGLLLELNSNMVPGLQVLRPFRIIRIFTYLPVRLRFQKFGKFHRALSLSRSSIMNLLFLMITLLTTYSLLGNAYFENIHSHSGLFHENTNFKSPHNSILITFQIFGFGGWDNIYSSFTSSTNEQGNDYSGSGLLFILICSGTSFILTCNMYFILILETINQLKISNIKQQQQQQDNNIIVQQEQGQHQPQHDEIHPINSSIVQEESQDSTENISLH